jgi:hypothetical protein
MYVEQGTSSQFNETHTLSDHSFVGKLHHILLLALVSLPASSSGTKEL